MPSRCDEDMNDSGTVILSSTPLPLGGADTFEQGFATWNAGTGGFQTLQTAAGTAPSTWRYYCCAPATPGF